MVPTGDITGSFRDFVRAILGSKLAVAALWAVSLYTAHVLSRDWYLGGAILAVHARADVVGRAASEAADPRKPDEQRETVMRRHGFVLIAFTHKLRRRQ